MIPGGRPAISALVTCYFEQESLPVFFAQLRRALESTGKTFEIILVNDGSTDATWDVIQQLGAAHECVAAALDFCKNAGQQAAVAAAVAESQGEAVLLIDSDLQLNPEDLPLLLAEYDKGLDMVTGYRLDRKDSFWRILPSKIANVIMRRASQSSLRDFGCTFKLFRGDVVRAFGFGPRHIFSNVEVISSIRRYAEVPVSHKARPMGKSGWTFTKLYRYNMENLVVMSELPFQWAALLCTLLAFLMVLRGVAGYFVPFTILPPVTNGFLLTVMAATFFFQSALICVGGEYTLRLFRRGRNLPVYIVREKFRRVEGVWGRVSTLN